MSKFLPFLDLSLCRKPWRLFLTLWLGSNVSLFGPLLCSKPPGPDTDAGRAAALGVSRVVLRERDVEVAGVRVGRFCAVKVERMLAKDEKVLVGGRRLDGVFVFMYGLGREDGKMGGYTFALVGLLMLLAWAVPSA